MSLFTFDFPIAKMSANIVKASLCTPQDKQKSTLLKHTVRVAVNSYSVGRSANEQGNGVIRQMLILFRINS